MMEQLEMRLFDRIMGWLLPAIVALTPLMVIYALIRPNVGQTFFFELTTLATLTGLGVAWMMGWHAMPRRWTAPAWLIALNVLALLGSLTASRNAIFSLKEAMLPGCGLIFFSLLILALDRHRLLERLRLVLIVMGGFLALYGVLQHFGIEFLHYSGQVEKNKVIATIGHPNYLASVLGPVLFIVLSFTFSRHHFLWKLLGGLMIFLILFCIMLARTRGVWLGIMFGTVAVVALGTRYCIQHRVGLAWFKHFALGIAVMLIALGVALFFILPALNAGIDIQERLQSDKEVKSRVYYWRAAVDLAMQKKVFGQGYAMFDPLFWDYALAQQKSEVGQYYYDVIPAISGRNPGHVHNEYLEVLTEQGFAGLTALVAFLGFFGFFGYLAIMRQEDPIIALQNVAVYGAFMAILVDALFGFPWRLPVSLIVSMVVLAWLYELIYPQEPVHNKQPQGIF